MADFFATGPVTLYVVPRQRYRTFYYLGTAVAWPEIEITKYARELKCDRSVDAPWQKVGASETHHVVVTLNRLNFEVLNLVRTKTLAPTTYSPSPGKLVFNSSDFELFLRWSPDGPTGTSGGRLYFSASYVGGREDQPQKVQEVGMVFVCNPIWNNSMEADKRKFKLYTESPLDPSWPKDGELSLE